ncbi:MAG: hypothetical protein WBB73_03865 [Candidatus Aminicenantaceae bacterium]
MIKENENTIINAKDLAWLRDELQKDDAVVKLHDLATKLAYRKNAGQLSQEVKVYDPNCEYAVGDLIYKEYDEQLLVSSKGMEHFKGAVVLKVINKISYDSFNCEMLEVDFSGGGTFRKHIEYMKKSKTQVLLPSATEDNCQAVAILEKVLDPRLTELPMTERDFRTLGKNLSSALSKSKDFFHWQDSYQLKEKQIAIEDDVIQKIEDLLRKTRKSAATADLVKNLMGANPKAGDFDLHCISLNTALDKRYKKRFTYISPDEKGKWFLKEILEEMLKDLPLAKPLAKLPASTETAAASPLSTKNYPLKVYLTWREVLSGGLTVPKPLVRELSKSREYDFFDTERGDRHTAYFYPTRGIFLGLGDLYKKHTITQGASLTLEKGEDHTIQFMLKRSKKGLNVPYVSYDAKKDSFSLADKEAPATSLPNKIIFLDGDALKTLETLYAERASLDLQDLLILVFKKFGLEGETLSLHLQRAFHLVDMLRHTNLADVERILNSTPEFIRSEKKKGLYHYKEFVEPEEEEADILEEELAAAAAAQVMPREDENMPAIGTVGEVETPTIILEEKVPVTPKPVPVKSAARAIRPTAPAAASKPAPRPTAKPQAEPDQSPKDDKPKKKKRKTKPAFESDKAPRKRKGERKIIEERIELEESEQEALIAVKSEGAEDDIGVDFGAAPEEALEEYKTINAEKPMKGLFGDMLKSALSQKQQDQTVIKGSEGKKAKSKAKKPKKEAKEEV